MVGGTERYYFDLGNLLESNGHKVAYFSMQDKNNLPSVWNKYFVSYVDITKTGFKNSIKKLMRMPYSIEARFKIGKLLNDFKPDIVHINNIYLFISPSILGEIKRRGIPIVQTIHDYQLISPVSNLYYKGQICEITKKHKYYKALANRKSGLYMTTLLSVASAYSQYLFKFFERNVDFFITPSKFLQKKLAEYDFTPRNITYIPNFTSFPLSTKNKKRGGYVLFFGRIDEAKGVMFLLEVIKKLPKIKFVYLGNFANSKLKKEIMNFIKDNKLKNIKIKSHLDAGKLRKVVLNSRFTITPSLWYENQPYTVIESYSCGKAVIGSKIGGIPEIIKSGKTGLLFKPGNTVDCAAKITTLWNNSKLLQKFGKNTMKEYKKYAPGTYYKKLMIIYKKVISSSNKNAN